MEAYVDALNLPEQDIMDTKFERVQQKLTSKFGDRVEMLRTLSVEAAKQFEDNSLDFVYIDGNHMYYAVMEDLTVWFPKIKAGGILAGDDVEDIHTPHDMNGNLLIQTEEGPFGLYGVHKALLEFKEAHPEFQFTLEGNQFIWRKPKT
jgi:hypothetical protein